MVTQQSRTQSASPRSSASTLITTAVGSYAKPDYLAKARTEFSTGKISREELDKLEKQATEYWIRAQEKVGLDVLVHGEMERGDMVAYFSGEAGGNPIKGMLTGAYTMVEWSFDEHYPSRRDAVLDMAKVIRREVEELVKAGCYYIQIDEPAIHTRPDEDFDMAVESMHATVDGIEAEFHTHICYGEVEKIYPAMLRLPVKQIHLAFKNTNFDYLKLIDEFGYDDEKDLGVGVTDVHTRFLESVDEVKDGIRDTLKRLPAERLWIYPDCGLKTRTTSESEDKLRVMVDAVTDIKRELGIS